MTRVRWFGYVQRRSIDVTVRKGDSIEIIGILIRRKRPKKI